MIRAFFVISLLAGLLPQLSAQALLEDFATVRRNGSGDNLFLLYLGEDPGQTGGIENGMFRVTGDPNRNMYWHFFPVPYVYPNGFAQGWIKSGSYNRDYNRLRFKVRCNQNLGRRSDGGNIIDIGTYVKTPSDTTSNVQGMHYYHGFSPNIYANRWVTMWIDRHPQHRVGDAGSIDPGDDPEWSSPTTGGQVHYMEGLTRFYFNGYSSITNSGATCYFDDFSFETGDNQADRDVASVTGTYSGSYYEVTWAGPKNRSVNFEVRYSTSSMKANGFTSGTDGGTTQNPGNDYQGTAWKSPNMAEQANMYVAIRPSGQTAFREILISTGNTAPAPPTASPCDINGDGAVNVTDINISRDAAIGKVSCSGDLDKNGRCDVVDTQRVVNASLGGACKTGL